MMIIFNIFVLMFTHFTELNRVLCVMDLMLIELVQSCLNKELLATTKAPIWWPKDFSPSSAIDQIYLVERDGMRIIHQKRHLFIWCKSRRVRYNRNHNHNHTRTKCNTAHPNCYRPLVATHQCCNNILLVVLFGRSVLTTGLSHRIQFLERKKNSHSPTTTSVSFDANGK